MANKNKNKKRSVSSSVETKAAAPVAVKTMGKSYSAEFNPDYSYVITDLKRIGGLAGIFFIVLLVLSFFLR